MQPNEKIKDSEINGLMDINSPERFRATKFRLSDYKLSVVANEWHLFVLNVTVILSGSSIFMKFSKHSWWYKKNSHEKNHQSYPICSVIGLDLVVLLYCDLFILVTNICHSNHRALCFCCSLFLVRSLYYNIMTFIIL